MAPISWIGMRTVFHIVLLCLHLTCFVSSWQHATASFSQGPFITVWNVPTAHCHTMYDVDLDLGVFNIVQNQNETFMGENISIFYSDKLGLYPSYIQQRPSNGGVPQNASLDKHLRLAEDDIRTNIPNRGFKGLAVLDWESWRPVWERNWNTKSVYWEGSRALVRSKHPDWNPSQVEVVAHEEFEEAARKFMEETLRLGERERPAGLWGYYGFPNCYNYYSDRSINYTGECPPSEIDRNNKLFWLWNVSSALYPDIYLSLDLRGLDNQVFLYTNHRILEAMRVGAQVTPSAPPVFPYFRIVYTYSLEFLSLEHLVYTIGESAALGSAGIILWGDATFAKSQASCKAVKKYIDGILGHYLMNVTTASSLCSHTVCSSRGRCQRRNPSSQVFLHLDPRFWKVTYRKGAEGGQNYHVEGQMTVHQVSDLRAKFQCLCYQGWEGEICNKPKQ